jgi:ubiquinone/menaquinone biosynthesis C-methylase UbiE
LSIIKNYPGAFRILGVDITPSMIQKARAYVHNESLQDHISLSIATAEKLPIADRSCDLVLCVLAIRHTTISKSLDEFMRILKNGGRLVIAALYAPTCWRSFLGRLLVPLAKIYLMHKKEMRAERSSRLLSLEEWKSLAVRSNGKNIQIQSFPNLTEPDWIPGKAIISWSKS